MQNDRDNQTTAPKRPGKTAIADAVKLLRSCACVLGNTVMFAGVKYFMPSVGWWIDLAVCLAVVAVVGWGWTGRWFA